MDISIFGLGYVGLISGTCLADDGHTVRGVDISEDKVDRINSGTPPLDEPGLEEKLRDLLEEGRLTATTSAAEALAKTDVTMICVGTPSGPDGEPDLRSVENVSRQIGRMLGDQTTEHTIILRSTVLPGTSENVINWLREASGRSLPGDLQYLYQPEFMREGNAIEDFYDPPFLVFGEAGSGGEELLANVYRNVEADVVKTKIREAELIKYVCNAFHALKIGFANEVGRLSRSLGVDARRVMDLVCRDRKLNISTSYLKPGYAFGGSCLPKDLRALVQESAKQEVSLPILEGILPSNTDHIDRAGELIRHSGAERIGVLGLRFKPGTDDVRESPTVKLCGTLKDEDALDLKIYDPFFSPETVHGANRLFLEEHLPRVEPLLTDSLEDLLDWTDTVMIGTAESDFREELLVHADRNLTVFDFPGLFDPADLPENWTVQGLCW